MKDVLDIFSDMAHDVFEITGEIIYEVLDAIVDFDDWK